MMDIKRIIEIARELDIESPSDSYTFTLKVQEPMRRAISKKKLDFINYLLTCTKEEREVLFSSYQAALRKSNVVIDGILQEGYEDTYRVYELMCEESGISKSKKLCIKI